MSYEPFWGLQFKWTSFCHAFHRNPMSEIRTVSNLYHKALSSSTPGSLIANQALREAFGVALHVSNGKIGFPACISQQSNVPNFELPEWFPYLLSPQKNGTVQSSKDVFCSQSIMEKFVFAGHQKSLRYTVPSSGKKRTKGRIAYKNMKPPWLRMDKLFVHGHNGNVFTLYSERRLPIES